MFRYRKTTKQYQKHHDPVCPFCHPKEGVVIRETKHAIVTKAQFSYDLWEFRDVIEHLLVIPKRHVKSLAELNAEERIEVIDLLAKYEGQEYNIYARSKSSVQRTVPLHQHTHLIKTADTHAKAAFYSRKPYFMLKV